MPMMRLEETVEGEELSAVTLDLTVALDNLEILQREKKELPGRIKGLEARVHELKEAVKARRVTRDVEVDEIPDFASGLMHIHRKDTGLKISDRPLRDDERQVPLGTVNGRLADLSEEQAAAATPEEAEDLRAARLAQERAERIAATVAEAKPRIRITPPDSPGLAYTALLDYAEISIIFDGATGAEASAKVVEALVAFLEQEAAFPDAPPAPAEEVPGEQARLEEIKKLAGEQASDDAKGKPRRGLQVPKGAKPPKTHKRIKATDADGNVIPPGDEPPVGDPPGDEPPPPPPTDENGDEIAF